MTREAESHISSHLLLLQTQTHTHTKIACNNNNPTDDSFDPLLPHPHITTSTPPPPPPPHTIKQSLSLTLRMTNPSISLFFFPHSTILSMHALPLSVNPTTPNSNTLHSPDHPTAYSAALTPPINTTLVCRFPICPFFSAPVSFPPLSLPLSLPFSLPLSFPLPSLLAGAGEISGQTDSSFFLWLRGVVLCDLALGCISALLMWERGEREREKKRETEWGREGNGEKEKKKCVSGCVCVRESERGGERGRKET